MQGAVARVGNRRPVAPQYLKHNPAGGAGEAGLAHHASIQRGGVAAAGVGGCNINRDIRLIELIQHNASVGGDVDRPGLAWLEREGAASVIGGATEELRVVYQRVGEV